MPTEKQVVSIVNQYSLLREGEWWRSVRDDLVENGTEPIESDAYLLQSKIAAAFDAAFMVQTEQMELFGASEDIKKTTKRMASLVKFWRRRKLRLRQHG